VIRLNGKIGKHADEAHSLKTLLGEEAEKRGEVEPFLDIIR
jgi:hypothetical protein